MTLKEKVAEVEPHRINDEKYDGGVEGCPCAYNYLNADRDKCDDICKEDVSSSSCEKCWNQEYKGV